MLNLNEIREACKEYEKQYGHFPSLKASVSAQWDFLDRARTWLLALVEELTQAREELAAVDESLGDFYAPAFDSETGEPCGSFWKDHGVNVMRQELERTQAEFERLLDYVQPALERLRVLVPSVDLLRCLADYTDSATDGQHHYQPDLAVSGLVAAREARALAQRIEETQAND